MRKNALTFFFTQYILHSAATIYEKDRFSPPLAVFFFALFLFTADIFQLQTYSFPAHKNNFRCVALFLPDTAVFHR